MSFLSFPVPECSCSGPGSQPASEVSVNASSPSSARPALHDVLAAMHQCPPWMDRNATSPSRNKESEEADDDVYEDDPDSSDAALLFRQGGDSSEGGVEMSNKEETQIDDQEELEGGER